jgi:hypothetical protein
MNLEFSRQIFEKYSKPYFMKILSEETELLNVDGRTDGQKDTTKIIVTFGNSAKSPKKALLHGLVHE